MDDNFIEIPIYLNRMQNPPHFSGEISLLQFPLRPNFRPYGDQGQLTSVEISSDAPCRVKMNYALNPSPESYDPQSEYPLREQSIISRTLGDSATSGLAVGVLCDGALTLVPLASVSQLRPSFNHMGAAGEVGVSGSSLTAKQTHYIELSENLKHLRGECVGWKHADYYEEDTPEADDIFNSQMVVTDSSQSLKTRDLNLHTELSEYLHAIGGVRPAEIVSSALSRVGVDKQIELIMKQKVCASYTDDIFPLLPANSRAYSSEMDIINALEEVAFLIRGYWVLKSTLTNHKPTLWRTRDVFLHNLRQGREIKAEVLASLPGNHSQAEIEALLTPLCQFEPTRNCWRFNHPEENREYMSKHPELVVRQNAAFDRLLQELRNEKEGKTVASASASDVGVVAARELLKTRGVTEVEELRKAIQARTPEKLISLESVPALLSSAGAVQVRSEWWALESFGNVQLDIYRGALIQIYRHRDSVTKIEILAEFERLTGRPCDLTDHELRKTLKEFARLDRGRWSFRGAQPS